MGGKVAAIRNKKLGAAIFDPEVRKKQHDTLKRKQVSAFYDPTLRYDISSKGGLNSLFSEKYRKRNNISEEEFKQQQSERGKIGGKGNKGFKWYNDGNKSYKYTLKMQNELSFDDFLKQNKQYKKGRKNK